MSLHEKEGNKEMPRPRQETIDNPSLYLCLCAMQLFCCLWIMGM